MNERARCVHPCPTMRGRLERIILVSYLVFAGATGASEPARTVTVAPGARYRAGWLYSFFLGAHWREAWTTPVEVPVLDLEAFDGGLRPDRPGGGMETTNLHFTTSDVKMSLPDYLERMNALVSDAPALQKALFEYLYFGKNLIIHRKRTLKLIYDIFIGGLALSLVLFTVAILRP